MDHNSVPDTSLDSAKLRNLREEPFVSLAEALTWIAFRDAMAPDELRAQVEGNRLPNIDSRFRADDDVPEVPGTGHFFHRQPGLEQLIKAWSYLRTQVDRGHLKVRGRYTAKYTLRDAQLSDVEYLKGDKIATFSQFDISTGGIRRRPLIREAITVGGVRHEPQYSSSVIWAGHPESYNREYESFGEDQRLADGYFLVEVERTGLLSKVSAAGLARAPSVKAGRAPHGKEILAKADEMKARGLDGRTIAKQMRLEPGFENVATTQVRELIKGRWKQGRRAKWQDG